MPTPDDTPAASPSPATPTPAPTPAAAPAQVFDLSIAEFCTRVSKGDRRVELISAFHADESAAGHFKDSEVNFAARFAAFISRPA